MSRPWIENEDGPDCACGSPTVVKFTPDGPVLMCFFHTQEAGAIFALPAECPDDWHMPTQEGLRT